MCALPGLREFRHFLVPVPDRDSYIFEVLAPPPKWINQAACMLADDSSTRSSRHSLSATCIADFLARHKPILKADVSPIDDEQLNNKR